MTIVTFPQRLAVGEAHELRVKDELEARGWTVDRWGQGRLSPRTRAVLASTENLLRFEADLIASRGDSELVMIDCKASMSGESGRRHVSRGSVRAALTLISERNVPLYFVFNDLKVVAPHELLRPELPELFRQGGAYYRMPTEVCVEFDAVFGRPRRSLAASVEKMAA